MCAVCTTAPARRGCRSRRCIGCTLPRRMCTRGSDATALIATSHVPAGRCRAVEPAAPASRGHPGRRTGSGPATRRKLAPQAARRTIQRPSAAPARIACERPVEVVEPDLDRLVAEPGGAQVGRDPRPQRPALLDRNAGRVDPEDRGAAQDEREDRRRERRPAGVAARRHRPAPPRRSVRPTTPTMVPVGPGQSGGCPTRPSCICMGTARSVPDAHRRRATRAHSSGGAHPRAPCVTGGTP